MRTVQKISATENIYHYTSQTRLNTHIETLRRKFLSNYEELPATSTSSGLDKYKAIQTLGAGAFGRVLLVVPKTNDGECYALKMQPKERILKTKQLQHILSEKAVLGAAEHPFLMHLVNSFKDTTYIYFLLPFVNGGDMFYLLGKLGKFNEVLSAFYAAQVTLAIEFLHRCNIIYRDLKPENILIDHEGYLKIIDFGFTKYIVTRTYSFCGTPEYIAPEIVLNRGYGFSIDWWSMGILLYEMTYGRSPFYARDEMTMYECIVKCKYKVRREFSRDLSDLIDKLLQTDISKRFGNLKGGVHDIKQHRWFRNISFSKIYTRSVDPPYKPAVKDKCDTSMFKRSNTESVDMPPPGELNMYSKEFQNF